MRSSLWWLSYVRTFSASASETAPSSLMEFDPKSSVVSAVFTFQDKLRASRRRVSFTNVFRQHEHGDNGGAILPVKRST